MLHTLKRAGDVLDLFTVDEPEWGVTATAQRLEVGKSLAHDALTSLAAIGMLQRVGHGRYRLGWRNLSLASVLLQTSELSARSRPVVRELAQRRGLTVSLVARDRGTLVYLNRPVVIANGTATGPPAGTTVPLDDSAAARVLLAGRPREEIATLWGQGLIQTLHRSLAELEADLEMVRRDGWAADAGATDAPATVAAPVHDAAGDVTAAISVNLASAPVSSSVSVNGRIALAAAARISRAMRADAVLRDGEGERRSVTRPHAVAGAVTGS